jgi:hypothetical protein
MHFICIPNHFVVENPNIDKKKESKKDHKINQGLPKF